MSPDPSDYGSASDDFHTTNWSLVAAAAERGAGRAAEALSQWCTVYWPPLYAYCRRRGYPIHEAQDLTQEFFMQLLDKQFLAAADPCRGRFRSFLLACLQHFLANVGKASRAQKRGGGKIKWSLDFQAAERAYQGSLADHRSPEQCYEQQWALLLLDRVLQRLASDFQATEKSRQFEVLRNYLATSDASQPYAAAAAQLEMSEPAVKMAVHRMRKRYRELLRDEIRQTVDRPEEVDDELRQLFATFARES